MIRQKHQEVLDLYHTLGIAEVENVNTTFSDGQINGWSLTDQHLADEQPVEDHNDYSSSTEQ